MSLIQMVLLVAVCVAVTLFTVVGVIERLRQRSYEEFCRKYRETRAEVERKARGQL